MSGYTQARKIGREGRACSNCGATYAVCIARAARIGKACCAECSFVDTHTERTIIDVDPAP